MRRPAKAKSSPARIGSKNTVSGESKSRVRSSEARIEGLVQDDHASNRDNLCPKQETSEVTAEKATLSDEVHKVVPKSGKAKNSASAKPKPSLAHTEEYGEMPDKVDEESPQVPKYSKGKKSSAAKPKSNLAQTGNLEEVTEIEGADNELPSSSREKRSSRRSNSGAKVTAEMSDKVDEESPVVPKHSKGKKSSSAKPKTSLAHTETLEVTESECLNTEVPSSSTGKRSSRRSNSGAKATAEMSDKVYDKSPEVPKHSKEKKSSAAKPKSILAHTENLEEVTESEGADNEVPSFSREKRSSRRSNSGAKASAEIPEVDEESPEVPKNLKGKKSSVVLPRARSKKGESEVTISAGVPTFDSNNDISVQPSARSKSGKKGFLQLLFSKQNNFMSNIQARILCSAK